jgi:hypothetical protein
LHLVRDHIPVNIECGVPDRKDAATIKYAPQL